MEIDIEITFPDLWGETSFQQDEWGYLNYFIGPNGTGKTLFSEKLESEISEYSVRNLNAERLSGMERQRYNSYNRSNLEDGFKLDNEDRYISRAQNYGLSSDAYIKLRNKPDLRIRVQSILSEFFNRKIELVVEAGYLKPKVSNIGDSGSYDLREDESHGLKELISLLTLIHDDEKEILIIDEPELHLHPQYQRFLLKEMQKLAGNPEKEGSRAFFIITHSPSMIEFRDLNDVKNVYSFNSTSTPPHSVTEFEANDEYHMKRLLPRLNSHHMEVLFAQKPVLVEGYTDEQIFSLIIENDEELTHNPKSPIIGVDGKEELNTFYRFCKKIGLEPRIIGDLDVLFEGNLRQTLSRDKHLQELYQEKGLDANLMGALGDVETELNEMIEDLKDIEDERDDIDTLAEISSVLEDSKESHKERYYLYRALKLNEEDLNGIVNSEDLRFINGRMDNIMDILDEYGCHILRTGELEDYLRDDNSVQKIAKSRKSDLFREKREGLLDCSSQKELVNIAGDLLPLLRTAFESREVSVIEYLEKPISDWMHDLQWEFREGRIQSTEGIKEHNDLGEDKFERIFEVESFELVGENNFVCQIRLKPTIDPMERTWEFKKDDSPADIDLTDVK